MHSKVSHNMISAIGVSLLVASAAVLAWGASLVFSAATL